MLKYIERHATGRNVLIFFAAAMIVYTFMMTVTIPAVTHEAHGLPVFDLRPGGYNAADAHTLLGAMSERGKWYYSHVQIPTDFLYPPLLGFFGAFAFAWLRRSVRFPRLLILLPFLSTLFDWLENIMILVMLGGHDGAGVVRTASTFTFLKSAFTSIFMTGLLLVGIIALIKVVAERTRRTRGTRRADEST